MRMPIADIEVGERRREEYGDLHALKRSIEKYGLLHPIVVSGKRLVAGERRLKACLLAGFSEIAVTDLGELDEQTRHELELEENVRRKDLSEYERSKHVTAYTDVVAERLRAEADFSPNLGEKSGRGRPSKPDSEDNIAAETGIPRQTIDRAREHVVAVEKYQELADANQSIAIAAAETLDALPTEDREEVLEAIRTDPKKVRVLAKAAKQRRKEQSEAEAKEAAEVLKTALGLVPGAKERVAEATLRADLSAGWETAFRKLFNLDPVDAGRTLRPRDYESYSRDIDRARDWLDRFEQTIRQPHLSVVGANA